MPQLLHDEEREVFTSVGLYEGSLSGIDEEHGARVRRLRIGQSPSHAGRPPAGRGDVSPLTPICRSEPTKLWRCGRKHASARSIDLFNALWQSLHALENLPTSELP